MALFRAGQLAVAAAVVAAGGTAWLAPRLSRAAVEQPSRARYTMEMVVGDTMRVNLRVPAAQRRRYRSSNTEIVAVTDSGDLIALRPGTTVITGTAAPGQTASQTIPTVVLTRRQATNMLINDVCPNTSEKYFGDSLPISSTIAQIHEFHDCQRLIIKKTYAGVVGIFASHNVAIYHNASDYSGGHLAAIIINFVGKKNSTTPYAPLGLLPGTNCLIVRFTDGVWQAAVVPQAAPVVTPSGVRYGDCPDHLTWADVPAAQMGHLVVQLQQHAVDMRDSAIAPPVARWDWDSRNAVNYVGVMCSDATWCEIGPKGFTTSVAMKTAAGNPIFKGYYDEQYLANRSGSSPTTVWGTLIPGADAHDVSQTAAHDPAVWYQMALMTLRETGGAASSGYNHYKNVFHAALAGSSPLVASSDVSLNPVSHAPTDGYNGRMHGVGLGVGSIKFTWHPSSAGVPTVRWRWKSKDEGTWEFCDPEGCCEDTRIF
jgi:hypothetical protein